MGRREFDKYRNRPRQGFTPDVTFLLPFFLFAASNQHPLSLFFLLLLLLLTHFCTRAFERFISLPVSLSLALSLFLFFLADFSERFELVNLIGRCRKMAL